jgi:multimeric flavodoxin WrbA
MKSALIITSKMLAKMCFDFIFTNNKSVEMIDLYSNLNGMNKVISLIDTADTIIMCGPCYIDHFPADTIYLLEQISMHPEILHNQSVYGIIQGGMPYVHTHESGVKTLELFCYDCNMTYKGSFVMGLGAMLNGQPLDKLLNGKKVKKNFMIFLNNILKNENSSSSLYEEAQIKLPSFIYKYMSKKMNAKINKDLAEKGIDYLKPSPYWNA